MWKSKRFVAFSNLHWDQQKFEFSNEEKDIFQFSSSQYFPLTFILFLLMPSNIFRGILLSRVVANVLSHFHIYSETSKNLCSPMRWETIDIFQLSKSHNSKPNFKPFKQLSKCSKHLNAALITCIFYVIITLFLLMPSIIKEHQRLGLLGTEDRLNFWLVSTDCNPCKKNMP